ncbi:hypothetical protein C8Q77DRAFT_920109 [Trametes polyzona]|nr:hypothetical protein C8Q77DRAFT_920109 [Trametes polyzona]
MSYGSGSRTGYHASPPRAITPSHCTGSPASSTLRTAGSSRAYTPAAIPHPAIAHPAIAHPAIAHPAIPRHVAAVARTPSEPPQPQVQADPSQHHDAPSRRSSAGHTPGLALRRLPQEEDPPPVSNNDRPPPPERNDRYRTATPRGIVAPTSARPQAMQTGGTVGGRLRPLEAARSPLSAEPTIWQFEPPPTPSAASTSSSSDDEPEPHGGFYDANGYPMRIKFGSDGWVHIPPPSTPPSAGSEMASSATLIQTPPTHAPRQAGGYGGHYLSPDSGPSVTPRARPNAAALRTVPRPRSNSYGL